MLGRVRGVCWVVCGSCVLGRVWCVYWACVSVGACVWCGCVGACMGCVLGCVEV